MITDSNTGYEPVSSLADLRTATTLRELTVVEVHEQEVGFEDGAVVGAAGHALEVGHFVEL